MIVRFKKLTDTAMTPAYQTAGAAGADVCADVSCMLRPGEWKLISTGLVLEVPVDHECQVRPRSGLAFKHGVTVMNAPGTIDSDYRGELKIMLLNHGKEDFVVNQGDRIAQLIISPCRTALFCEHQDLSETDRGAGGFGSTGQ